MQVNVQDTKAKSGSMIELPDALFACDTNESLIHQVVVAFNAAGRAGTRAQKTRSEVSGGGIKPWRQKGSGRARAGSSRSPIWRKGGVTFAAKPQCFEQKVNRKMYRAAIRSIVSTLLRDERMVIVKDFELATPKTKELLKKLETFKFNGSVLIVPEVVSDNLGLASRNVYRVGVTDVTGLNPVVLLGFDKIVLTVPALQQLQEQLA